MNLVIGPLSVVINYLVNSFSGGGTGDGGFRALNVDIVTLDLIKFFRGVCGVGNGGLRDTGLVVILLTFVMNG